MSAAKQHPHSKVSADKLSNIKIRNKQICVIDGLPLDVTEQILRGKHWYGRFKGIINIEIKKHNKKATSLTAWITFKSQKQRDDAIEFSNYCAFDDGRILKATHGWNYYCKAFIKGKKCTSKQCTDSHEWVNDIKEDILTPAAMIRYQSKPFGIIRASKDRPEKIMDLNLESIAFGNDNINNNMFEKRKVNRMGDRCHKCGDFGHWERDCNAIKTYCLGTYGGQQMDEPQCDHCGNIGHLAWECNNECNDTQIESFKEQYDNTRHDYDILLQQYEEMLIKQRSNNATINELRQMLKTSQRTHSVDTVSIQLKKQMIVEVAKLKNRINELETSNSDKNILISNLRKQIKELKRNNKDNNNKKMQILREENKSDAMIANQKKSKRKRRRKKKKGGGIAGMNEQINDQDMITQQKELWVFGQMARDDLILEISKLSNTIKELEMINQEERDRKSVITKNYKLLEQKHKMAMMEKDGLQDALNTLQDDYKELEIKYNELEDEYNENKKKCDYKSWNALDAVNWIINLDKRRYNKYKEILEQNMVKEEIDGECLKDLDKNDLHRLGITVFKDKRDIFEKLQQLIHNDNYHTNDMQNEGKITST